MKVLVLDGESNAGRAVAQSLGRARLPVWLAAHGSGHPAARSRLLRGVFDHPDPMRDKPGFQGWIEQIQRAERFDHIIPCTERSLWPLHELRDRPGLAGHLALPPTGALERVNDKESLRQLADALRVPTPPTLLVRRLEQLDDVRIASWLSSGAAVVKSVRSKVWQDGRGHDCPVRIATDLRSLRQCVARLLPLTPVQVQQWLPGRGVGIHLLADRGRIALQVAHERLHELPLTGGGSSYRRTIATPPRLLEEAARLVDALGWHGVAMIEYRISGDRHWLMEINGRFWGSLPLSLFAGIDFPVALLELLGGRPVAPRTPRIGVHARHVPRDLSWTKALVRHRLVRADPRLRALVAAPPLGRSLFEWGRIFTGTERWDGASLRDPLPFLGELGAFAAAELGEVRRRVVRRARLALAPLHSRRALQRARSARRVLVLCKGNICRSPYAAARLGAAARRHGIAIRSAGFLAAGRPTPERFAAAARRRGVELGSHRSLQLDPALVAWADLVLLMDEDNAHLLAASGLRPRVPVLWLGALDPGDGIEITDPYDADGDGIEQCLDRLDRCIELLAELLEPVAMRHRHAPLTSI
jgi:protein-tyrosine-phosphatase/predicted ATP-grasp superfamily ATP-dependent carboligase